MMFQNYNFYVLNNTRVYNVKTLKCKLFSFWRMMFQCLRANRAFACNIILYYFTGNICHYLNLFACRGHSFPSRFMAENENSFQRNVEAYFRTKGECIDKKKKKKKELNLVQCSFRIGIGECMWADMRVIILLSQSLRIQIFLENPHWSSDSFCNLQRL